MNPNQGALFADDVFFLGGIMSKVEQHVNNVNGRSNNEVAAKVSYLVDTLNAVYKQIGSKEPPTA